MKKSLLALAMLVVFNANAADSKTWGGTIQLWTSEICRVEIGCDPLPKRLGPEWDVSMSMPEKTEIGHHILAKGTYKSEEWTVALLVARVNPADKSESYLITQTSLHHAKTGLLAQCSRYDGLDAFDFLPPGACSGAKDGKLFGVSLFSPAARK